MPFTYMGTKKQIVSDVAEVIASATDGPLLDLFAGISTVATAVASTRAVWCNDAERFAFDLATAKFNSPSAPVINASLLREITGLMTSNRQRLLSIFGSWILEEDNVLLNGGIRQTSVYVKRQVAFAQSSRAQSLRKKHRTYGGVPYCLFFLNYMGGYIGARQASDIDSLRFAFDTLLASDAINAEQHRWYLLALCKALFTVSNTTGHFAQFLDVKSSSLNRFRAKRRRDIFSEWAAALNELQPCGTPEWRQNNKTFRMDANELLFHLKGEAIVPGVIYADPPYTSDQYSRYYHLWDTLLAYDYPDMEGKGQYRPNRFVSDFSLRTKVVPAFEKLISRAADLGSDLIINYPENGLVPDTRSSILGILRTYFRRAELAKVIGHEHSSMGASKGVERAPVRELIFFAS